MAIAIENTTSNAVGTNDASFSHTGTGSNLVAVVVIGQRYGAEGIETNGVTYGGNVMTRSIGAFAFVGSYIYHYLNAPSGVQTVAVNFVAGSSTRSRAVTAHTLTGANTSSQPNTSNSGGAGSGTSLSVSVTTSVDGCLLFDSFAGTNTGAPSITGGQTSVRSGTWTSGSYGQSYESKATAGTESMSWSFTTGENQLTVAAFAPAAASATFIPRVIMY